MYQLLQEYICIRISNTAGREWLTCTACGVLVWRIYRRLCVVYYLIPSSKMPISRQAACVSLSVPSFLAAAESVCQTDDVVVWVTIPG